MTLGGSNGTMTRLGSSDNRRGRGRGRGRRGRGRRGSLVTPANTKDAAGKISLATANRKKMIIKLQFILQKLKMTKKLQ